jgi:hypothetical protein
MPFHTMPYFSMPCHAMACLCMPCLAMCFHAMPCLAMPCHAMPCHPCLSMPCHAMPCLAIVWYAFPCHAPPYHALQCHALHSLSCLVFPYHAFPYHALPCHAMSCRALRFLCPEEELDKSPRNGLGCHLQLGIKRKPRLRLRNRRLRWITGIGFQLENPSLSGAMPQKLLYSLILRISVFLSLKQCNIWIKGSNL